jgi:hypothetical protein
LQSNTENQEVKSYLLGKLPSDTQAAFEERLLVDAELYEELLVTEDELIDQYVTGSLSKDERHDFETHFLITAERQSKLRFGSLFRRYLQSRTVDVLQEESQPIEPRSARKPLAPSRKSSLFFGQFSSNPLLAVSIAIVVCLGLVALYWAVIKKQPDNQSRRTLVVALASGTTRSGGDTQRIRAPSNETEVRLELELAKAELQNYKAELFRENESVKLAQGLRPEAHGSHYVIPFNVAGEILSPGDYQVKLSGILDSGQIELLGSYSFRITAD